MLNFVEKKNVEDDWLLSEKFKSSHDDSLFISGLLHNYPSFKINLNKENNVFFLIKILPFCPIKSKVNHNKGKKINKTQKKIHFHFFFL